MRSHIVITAALVAALVAPAAAATWRVHGTYEPDTMLDVSSLQNHFSPDTDSNPGVRKVYINGYTDIGFIGQNPNLPTGSRLYWAPAQTHHVMLGIWKDCNNDGYVGIGDGAVMEYRSELLLDTSICRAGVSPHNDGKWVYEWKPIGPTDRTNASFVPPGAINDTESLVWGDLGVPGLAPGRTCAVNPRPAGTAGSTGGALFFLDCMTGRQGANTVNTVDNALGLGIGFDDPNNPQTSDSPLNQHFPVNPFGNPYAPEGHRYGLLEREEPNNASSRPPPAFTTWDCSQPAWQDVKDPSGTRRQLSASDPTGGALTGAVAPNTVVFYDHDGNPNTPGVWTYNLTDEDGSYVTVARPDPKLHDPTASYYAALNETNRGANNVASTGYAGDSPATGDPSPENCDTRRQTAMSNNYPDLEQDYVGVTVKRQTDLFFTFGGDNVGRNTAAGAVLNDTLGASRPQDLGVGLARNAVLGSTGTWYGAPNYITTPQSISRADFKPQGGLYTVYYAKVGAATAAAGGTLPAGAGTTYGAEWCAGDTTNVKNGFDCDKNRWWKPAFGASSEPTQGGQFASVAAFPGFAVHLRDFDCADGTLVRGVPVHASLVDLDEEDGGACADAPGTVLG